VPIVLNAGRLNLLETSRLAQACNGIALPFTLVHLIGFTIDVAVFLQTICLMLACLILQILFFSVNIIMVILTKYFSGGQIKKN